MDRVPLDAWQRRRIGGLQNGQNRAFHVPPRVVGSLWRFCTSCSINKWANFYFPKIDFSRKRGKNGRKFSTGANEFVWFSFRSVRREREHDIDRFYKKKKGEKIPSSHENNRNLPELLFRERCTRWRACMRACVRFDWGEGREKKEKNQSSLHPHPSLANLRETKLFR